MMYKSILSLARLFDGECPPSGFIRREKAGDTPHRKTLFPAQSVI